jgi:hypothetical protein
MQLKQCSRRNVGVDGSSATEYQRPPVNYDLQSLEPTAVPNPGGIVWDIAIDEGIWLAAIIDRRRVAGGATCVLDDVDIAFGIGVDTLIASLSKESIEG